MEVKGEKEVLREIGRRGAMFNLSNKGNLYSCKGSFLPGMLGHKPEGKRGCINRRLKESQCRGKIGGKKKGTSSTCPPREGIITPYLPMGAASGPCRREGVGENLLSQQEQSNRDKKNLGLQKRLQ